MREMLFHFLFLNIMTALAAFVAWSQASSLKKTAVHLSPTVVAAEQSPPSQEENNRSSESSFSFDLK